MRNCPKCGKGMDEEIWFDVCLECYAKQPKPKPMSNPYSLLMDVHVTPDEHCDYDDDRPY